MSIRNLEITTIAGCKISCSYCPQGMLAIEHKKVSNDRLLSFDDFVKCLSTVPVDVDIHFSGYSEPFLNPDCMKMIKHAHDRGHQISVYTTVVGMALEDVSELEKLSYKKFKMHLPDGGTHMRVKVDEDYLTVMNRLINASIINLNYISYFGIHPEVLPLIDNDKLLQVGLTSRGGNVEKDVVEKPVLITKPLRCRVNRLMKNVLLPNGDVTLCCVDYGKRHVIGNLLSDRYDDLHISSAFVEIKKRMNGKPGDLLCRTCEWAEPTTWKHRFKEIVKKVIE